MMKDNLVVYGDYLEKISNSRTFKTKFRWIEHNFGSLFSPGLRVLEIGPGRGEFLHFLTQRAISQIDVVDQDDRVLEYVKSKFPVRNAWKCSAEELPSLDFQLQTYDRVFLLQVMEHIEKSALLSFLRIIYKHLSVGGQIIITVPNGGNPLSIVERYSDITHCNLFSENSLKELVEFMGVEGVTSRVCGYRIPPSSLINCFRIFLQKGLHLFLKIIMIVNGGVFFSIYDPNVTLIIEKSECLGKS